MKRSKETRAAKRLAEERRIRPARSPSERRAAARRGAAAAVARAGSTRAGILVREFDRQILTLSDAAARIGVSKDLLAKLVGSKELPATWVPRGGGAPPLCFVAVSDLRAVRDRLVDRYARFKSPTYRRLLAALKKAKV